MTTVRCVSYRVPPPCWGDPWDSDKRSGPWIIRAGGDHPGTQIIYLGKKKRPKNFFALHAAKISGIIWSPKARPLTFVFLIGILTYFFPV